MRTHSNASRVTVHHADAFTLLRTLPAGSIDAVVTDPPYAIRSPAGRSRLAPGGSEPGGREGSPEAEWKQYADAEMLGQQSANWNETATHSRGYADNDPVHFQRWCELWLGECLRVLKPGGHLVAFGGTRTWHRLATAAETTGFEIRDSLAWLYATGFPKSLNAGTAVQNLEQKRSTQGASDSSDTWEGWGTALKPAFEPIVFARVPLDGTVANNLTTHRTGAINIDGGRLGDNRWPTNAYLDEHQCRLLDGIDASLPSRFFWHAKPSSRERVAVDGVKHPTVKPLALMRELVRLVTPPGGTVLDPFGGSGTTVEACIAEGVSCIAVEREAGYIPLIEARISRQRGESGPYSGIREQVALF
ncbi:DNA-methyltransferase [Nocardioides sp. GCM10030258]|uniref:DNA-methyltransferase n=1 Tax=unclassified Nocardioides TaxID=2615069 RepID=UPI0036143821